MIELDRMWRVNVEDERTPAVFNLNTDLQLRSGTVGSHTAVSSGPCSVSSDQNHPAEKLVRTLFPGETEALWDTPLTDGVTSWRRGLGGGGVVGSLGVNVGVMCSLLVCCGLSVSC